MILSKFLDLFLNVLNKQNIEYLIERNYEQLPQYTSNDIDFLIANSDKERFVSIVMNVIKRLDMKVLLITTAYGGGRIYLSDPKTQVISIIRIDFMTHIHFRGIPLLNAEIILENRKKRNIFYVPTAGMEAAISLIIPLIYAGKVKEKYKGNIYQWCMIDTENFVNAFTPFLPSKKIQNIVDLVTEKKIHVIEEQRKQILLSYVFYNKYKSLSGIMKSIASYFQRIVNPSGVLIVVMGSDGSGKSSVINNLSESIKILYPKGRFVKVHWRPGVLPQLSSLIGKSTLENEFVATSPHGAKKRSKVTSFLRWLYYSFDYIVGYYFKILALKIKSTVVIMDRYYYDIIVDPVRYGFNIPQWLLKSMIPIIPKPDLTIYLDNTSEELHKRKQELPISELKRQVKAWREFIPSLPNARIVTTDKPLESVVHEVTRLVLERRAEMTRRTLKIEPEASQYLGKSDISDYIALPSKKNCRWIIPKEPYLARKAWDLYLPYSFAGRVYKNALKLISSNGLLKHFQPKRLTLELTDESESLRKCIAKVFNRDDFVLALSTGTPGPFSKITAMILASDGNTLGYAKIGETPLAIERIKHEARVLKRIVISYQLSIVRLPECLYAGEVGRTFVLIQSSPPFKGKTGNSNYNRDYAEVLSILMSNTRLKKKFTASKFYKNLKHGIDSYPLSYRNFLKDALHYLEESIGDKKIIFSLSHGDFVPWNMFWNGKKVFLFDWEFANDEAPIGIDIVDFLFNTEFLVYGQNNNSLLKIIIKKMEDYNNINCEKHICLSCKDLCLSYFLHKSVEQDQYYLLNNRAVQRRKMIKLLLNNS